MYVCEKKNMRNTENGRSKRTKQKQQNSSNSTWAILVFCVNLSYGDLCTILHPQQQQQMADACKD